MFGIDDAIGGVIGSAIGGAGSYFGQQSANRANKDMAREANAANLSMNRENNAFSERMSSTSWQRGVEDMKKAGINPMLAFSKGGASSPSGSVIGATAGNAQQNSFAGVPHAISSAIGISRLKADLDNLKANAEKTKSDTALNRQLSETSKSQAALNSSSAISALANAKRADADAANTRALLTGLLNKNDWDASTIGKVLSSMNFSLGAFNPFVSSANGLVDLGHSTVNFLKRR